MSQTLERTKSLTSSNGNSPRFVQMLSLVLEFSFQAFYFNLQLDVLKSKQALIIINCHRHLVRQRKTYIIWYQLYVEKEMATHSSILAWRIPWTRAWWAPVHGIAKSRTQLERLTYTYVEYKIWHKWTYLQNRNRLKDIENKLMITKVEVGSMGLEVWD